jgi:nucleoside-diphosphate-sugar epimerase
MAILVTGAAGFVALNIVEHLLEQGRAVVAFDRIAPPERATRHFATLRGVLSWRHGDILSAEDLRAAFITTPIEAVIHCAVITAGTARETSDPETILAVNVQGAAATLMEATRQGVRRFVYPSSGAIYGEAARNAAILDEDALKPAPVNLYGLTKRAAETILPRIAETQGVRFNAVRLGSVYGPWEYATGVRDTLSSMLQSIELARAGDEAVLGPAWTGDFIYVRDVAAGLVRVLDAPDLPRVVYNLGSGVANSAVTWCQALAAARPGFRWRLARAGEPHNVESHTGFDRPAMRIDRLRADTGFCARFDFPAAARDWLAWYERR